MSNTGPLPLGCQMICEPTDKEAGVTFTDAFMHQLHSGYVAADSSLVKAAPTTLIRGKGDNSEVQCAHSPAVLGHTLLRSYLCSPWESRETSQSPKSIFLRGDARLQKTRVIIFSTLLFCDSSC